jgi:hypothetical protein
VAAVVGGLLVFLLVLGLVSGGGQSGDKKRASRAPTPAGKPRPQRRPHPVPRVVTVKVGPVTPTYVCVDNGPGTGIVFEGILQRPRTFRGKKLRINLGKRSASVTYDGRPVQIQPSPEPDGFEFSPSGRKEIPPTQRPCL